MYGPTEMTTHNQQATPRSKTSSSLLSDLPVSQRRGLRRNALFITTTLGIIAALSLASKAHAAGGSYVVDDGAVNDPGQCNSDVWYTSNRHDRSTNSTVLDTACTFQGLPGFQWGLTAQRDRSEGDTLNLLSPQLKAQLLANKDLGIEMAFTTTGHFALDRGHAFDGADFTIPFTYQPFEALRINVDAGWTHAYNDGDQQHAWTWGTGFEYTVVDSLTLIAERYGQQGGDQSWQAGPRLHLGPNVDIDLVLGRNLTGDRDQWLTTGATFRF